MSRPPALVGEISTPVSAREALADRFLARVARLTPEEWGRLDAIAQRDRAGDPVARWRHARRTASTADAPVLGTILTGVGVALRLALDVAAAVTPRPVARSRPLVPRAESGAPTEPYGFARRLETLRDTARARAGGEGDATVVLSLALAALWERSWISPEAFVRRYELVEPVIPLRSLER